MRFDVSIQQPTNHSLVLRFVFHRLILEKINASLAQGDGDLYIFVPKSQLIWRGK